MLASSLTLLKKWHRERKKSSYSYSFSMQVGPRVLRISDLSADIRGYIRSERIWTGSGYDMADLDGSNFSTDPTEKLWIDPFYLVFLKVSFFEKNLILERHYIFSQQLNTLPFLFLKYINQVFLMHSTQTQYFFFIVLTILRFY